MRIEMFGQADGYVAIGFSDDQNMVRYTQAFYIYIYAFSRHFYPKRLTSGYTFVFYQYVCSLGIEPTTFCAANAML